MERSRPEGSLFVIGLFLDRHTDAQSLDLVGAALLARGARFTGEAWLGTTDPGPFDYVTDLALVSVDDWPAPREDLRPYRTWLIIDGLGPAVLSFGKGDKLGGRPVEILLETDLCDVPGEYLDDDERAEAAQRRRSVVTLCRELCEELDPAYGTIHVEEPTPTPTRMRAGEFFWPLPDDLFVSARLGLPEAGMHESAGARDPAALKELWQRIGTAVSALGWADRSG
ncbi:hypothetical protein Ait01nite_068120 [Actinoplanes italicus]|uniref:Uncharacterized protein n=1 Tax=Actinoplanes italicus TaxID=113567 RepID=A0A2T0K1D6_9ACTN|nr:hypothetical protein [Actinoplanes italicus]PRX16560.1 hypothetical protein CLV67_119141 [Actinoplanes italicus]GIE33767.1 hypothetical protein Ait01nite_068120 [Actinoplanes italicus]